MSFLMNLLILMNLTLMAGILPLIERKYLSLIQSRVGPTFVGYKGSLQYMADALKMFLKGCLMPNSANQFYFLFYPSLVLSICYLFWLNSFWGVNLIYFELEYNMVYLSMMSGLVNFFMMLTGVFSLNKYATVAALSTVVMLFCLELLLGLFLLNVVIYSNSFNFSFLFTLQEELPLIGVFFFASSVILMVVLMEVNSAPFDLNEAESELVSGYHVEYGAFFFGLFYLGEYFHLFFFSVTMTMLLTGF